MSNARKLAKLIVGTELKASNVDSDLSNKISSIKARLDSDDNKIQSLNTSLDSVSSVAGLLDSDLKVVADLRNQLDSEIIYVRNLSLSYNSYLYNATDGQTTFQDSDANSATLAYTAGAIQVFLNGIKLESDDYTATDGTSIVLTEAAITNAQLIIICPKLESNNVSGVSVSFDSGIFLQHQWGGTDTAYYGANATLSDDGMYLAISSLAANFGGSGQPDSAGHIDIWKSDGTTNSWTHQTTIDWNDFNSAFSGTQILQNNNTFGRFKMQLNNDGSRLLVSNPYADIGGLAYRGTVALLSRSGTTWSFVQGTSNPSVPLAPSIMPVTGTNMATIANVYYGNQSAMANGTGNNNGQVIAANYVYNGNASTSPQYIQGNIISIYKHDRTDGKINNTSFQDIDFRTQTNNSFAPTRGQGQLAFSANGEWLAIGYNNTHQTGQSFASTTWNAADYHRGVVYLYKSTNTSTRTDYTQQQYILGPTGHNGSSGGKFGRRVEMSDSGTLLVLQQNGDHSTISGAIGVGRVYIYTLSGSTWSQLQILEAPTTGTGSNVASNIFGHLMAISGDASYIAISSGDTEISESIIHIYKINGSNTYDLVDTITCDTNNTSVADPFYFDNNMLSITSNGFLSIGIPSSDKYGTNDGQVQVFKT